MLVVVPKITEGQYALGALTIFSIWVFMVLPFLYRQEPIYKYQPYPSTTSQNTTNDPKGTPEAPFFIQVLPGPDAAEKANEEHEDRLEKQSADRWLVRWTMALFVATACLFVSTGVVGYFAYRQIGLARDEFFSTHRPKIRIKHLLLANDIWGENRTDRRKLDMR